MQFKDQRNFYLCLFYDKSKSFLISYNLTKVFHIKNFKFCISYFYSEFNELYCSYIHFKNKFVSLHHLQWIKNSFKKTRGIHHALSCRIQSKYNNLYKLWSHPSPSQWLFKPAGPSFAPWFFEILLRMFWLIIPKQ